MEEWFGFFVKDTPQLILSFHKAQTLRSISVDSTFSQANDTNCFPELGL